MKEWYYLVTFETTGLVNTEATLKIAVEYAKEHGCDIVAATSTGETIFKLKEIADESGFQNRIVAVTHVFGMHEKGVNDMSPETFEKLKAMDVKTVTAAHALSGAERGISSKFHGTYPAEIISAALRMFGQGTKVCVEVALMAVDSGNITYGKPVVCVGGSSHGADTACVITPGYTACLLETKIHEILCKPSLM